MKKINRKKIKLLMNKNFKKLINKFRKRKLKEIIIMLIILITKILNKILHLLSIIQKVSLTMGLIVLIEHQIILKIRPM